MANSPLPGGMTEAKLVPAEDLRFIGPHHGGGPTR